MGTIIAGLFRAYDTMTEWRGPIRRRRDAAERDARRHNDGCAKQGGAGHAIVVRPEAPGWFAVGPDGATVWPPHGATDGAVRFRDGRDDDAESAAEVAKASHDAWNAWRFPTDAERAKGRSSWNVFWVGSAADPFDAARMLREHGGGQVQEGLGGEVWAIPSSGI